MNQGAPIWAYRARGMNDPVELRKIRRSQYSVIAGCQTLELTRDEAIRLSEVILKDARKRWAQK